MKPLKFQTSKENHELQGCQNLPLFDSSRDYISWKNNWRYFIHGRICGCRFRIFVFQELFWV